MTAVLVVEDDTAQREGLTALLRDAGFQVHAASGGDEALALGERVKPDAAICDWNLGSSPDGAAVVQKLQSSFPDLVPIFITGNDVSRLRQLTRRVRAASYFAKPVVPERLLEALTLAGCRP